MSVVALAPSASALTEFPAPAVDGAVVTWDEALGGDARIMLCGTAATHTVNGTDGCIMINLPPGGGYGMGAAGEAKYSTAVAGTSHTFASGDDVSTWVAYTFSPSGSASLPGGTYLLTVFSTVTGNYSALAQIVIAGGDVASAATPLTLPVQQFAVAAGTSPQECAALAPAWADWEALGPLRHDGWSVSWAHWPHDGAGGTVCTRQPALTDGTWTVGD